MQECHDGTTVRVGCLGVPNAQTVNGNVSYDEKLYQGLSLYAASPSLDLLCFPESLQLLLQQVHSSGPQSYAVTIHDFCPCLHKLLITAVPGPRAPKYVHPMPHVVSAPRPNVVSIILLRGLLRPWSTQPPDLLS